MNKEEILRYLRTSSSTNNGQILSLVDEAMRDIAAAAAPKTLYRIYDCKISGDVVTVGGVDFKSSRLAENLQGCGRVVVFGATLGVEVDRIISLAAATDVAKAMAYQAAAASEIESVCDELENKIKAEHSCTLRRRYSPGYFDLDITAQKEFFTLLELTKRIGLTLTETCEMLPTKSVTAFIGIED